VFVYLYVCVRVGVRMLMRMSIRIPTIDGQNLAPPHLVSFAPPL